MPYLSLQEVSATQTGQRQFKAVDTESFDGYQKVAQYATHFVEIDDAKKVDLIAKIPSTFTVFTLFENAASPYYVGHIACLKPAEGRIFFKQETPGFFRVMDSFRKGETTHFMTTTLATAEEMRLKSLDAVFPAEFLSVFKKNNREVAVLEPIYKLNADWVLPMDTPVRVPRYVVSLQKSVEDPDLLLLMPILTMPTAPNAKCDYYLEGDDQKQMALLVNNLRWNSRTQDFRFTEDDIKKVVSDLKVNATLHAVSKHTEVVDISDDEEVATFHAAAQIIAKVKANPACSSNVASEAEIAEVQQAAIDSNEPKMWYLFFKSIEYYPHSDRRLKAKFIHEDESTEKPGVYFVTQSTDKAMLEGLLKSYKEDFIFHSELEEFLKKKNLPLKDFYFTAPVAAESSSPASPPPELFDTEPETPPENEVLYVFLDHDTKTDEMTAVRKEFGPLSIADFAYDHEFYIRFPEFGDGLQFFELNKFKSNARSELQADLDSMFPGTSGIQELPKIDEPEEESYDFDDSIVKAVLEVASRKRTERCSDEPVSQSKRTRRPRRSELELLSC